MLRNAYSEGKGKNKGFLFNVRSRRKPESLLPAEPTVGIRDAERFIVKTVIILHRVYLPVFRGDEK